MKSCSKGQLGLRVPATLLVAILSASLCRGETAFFGEPDLDTWVYENATYTPGVPGATPGSRFFAPSFGGLTLDESTNQLNPGTNSRSGYKVFAFETSNEIETGLPLDRYLVHSVTATVRAERGQQGPLTYSAQPLTIASVTNGMINENFGSQVPVELFGVGFNGGYDGFALGDAPAIQPYSEADPVWTSNEYLLYPVDAEGRDSVNSLNGGVSSSEPSGTTAPFTHTPFAIGTVPGATEGAALPNDTTFEFDLDLTNQGVLDYVKQGMSDGVLGFTVSTLHFATFTGQFATGGFYPQWYTKEASQFFQNAEPASLTIEFEILSLPGDYDANGFVDDNDYELWRSQFGTAGPDADGNRDGVVDAADYTVWQDYEGSGTPPASALGTAGTSVPEPTTARLLACVVMMAGFCGWVNWFTRARREQRR